MHKYPQSKLMIATTEPRIAAMLEGSKSEKKPLIKGIIEDKAAELGFHWK
jgi:hypothetical protein